MIRAKFVLAIGPIRVGELTFEFSGAFLGVVFAHRQMFASECWQ